MLPPLRDETRRTLFGIALLIGASSASLLPLTAQSSFEARAQAQPMGDDISVPPIPTNADVRQFSVARDPFVPDAEPPEQPVEAATRVEAPGGIVVRAIILGPRSRALVETRGSVSVLGVGDRIGDASIVGIGRSGVVLSDGRTIAVEGSR